MRCTWSLCSASNHHSFCVFLYPRDGTFRSRNDLYKLGIEIIPTPPQNSQITFSAAVKWWKFIKAKTFFCKSTKTTFLTVIYLCKSILERLFSSLTQYGELVTFPSNSGLWKKDLFFLFLQKREKIPKLLFFAVWSCLFLQISLSRGSWWRGLRWSSFLQFCGRLLWRS